MDFTNGPARVAGVLLAALAFAAPVARGGDFDEWKWRMPLVFTGYPDLALRDFPALVRLPAEVAEGALANGVDLRFAGVDGEVFDYDIDTWKPGGESLAWVRVPRLAENTPVFAYWGNPRAWPQNQEETWSGGHVAVWHFSTHHGLMKNSARPLLHAYNHGSLASVPGVAGNGVGLSNGWYPFAHENPALNLQDTFTVSGWFKLADGVHPRSQWPLFSHRLNNSQEGWEVLTGFGPFNSIVMRGNRVHYSGTAMPPETGFEVEPRAWRHITAQYRGPGRGTLFVDGVKAGDTDLGNGRASDIMGGFFIGISPHGGPVWKGWVDEVRIENVVRHESWVRANYDTVMDPGFAAYGEPAPNNGSILAVAARVGETNATLVGLHPAGMKAAAVLHWGSADGGEDPAKWQHKAGGAEGSQPGAPVFEIAGLARGTPYFARVLAGAEWGEALRFTTLPAPAPVLGRVSVASAPGTNTHFTVRVLQLPPNPVLTLECGGQKHTLTPSVGKNTVAVPALPRNTPHAYTVTLSGATGRVETNGVFHASYLGRWANDPAVNYTNTYPTNHWTAAERWAGGVVPNGVGDTAVLHSAYGKTFIDGMGTLTLGTLDMYNLLWNPFEIISTNNARVVFDNGGEPARILFSGVPNANPAFRAPVVFKGPTHVAGEGPPLVFSGDLAGPGPVLFSGGIIQFQAHADTARRVGVPILGGPGSVLTKNGPGDVVFAGQTHSSAFPTGSPQVHFIGNGRVIFNGAVFTNLNNNTGSYLFRQPDCQLVFTNNARLVQRHPATYVFNSSNSVVRVHRSIVQLPAVNLNAENNALLIEDGGRVEMVHGNLQCTGPSSMVALRSETPGRISTLDLRERFLELTGMNSHLLLKTGAVATNGNVSARANSNITVDGGKLYANQLVVQGARMTLRAAAAPGVIVAGDVDLRNNTLTVSNPDGLHGAFPLLAARRIVALPNLDAEKNPGATLAVSEDGTTLLVNLPAP